MDYKKASDQDLWRLCQKQDDIKAHAELFDRYVIPLRRQTVRYIKSDFDAEEIVMDLMFNLWAKRVRLNPDSDSLKKYFYRALHNRIINHLKKKLPVIVSMDTATEDDISSFLSSDHRIIEQEISAAFQARWSCYLWVETDLKNKELNLLNIWHEYLKNLLKSWQLNYPV